MVHEDVWQGPWGRKPQSEDPASPSGKTDWLIWQGNLHEQDGSTSQIASKEMAEQPVYHIWGLTNIQGLYGIPHMIWWVTDAQTGSMTLYKHCIRKMDTYCDIYIIIYRSGMVNSNTVNSKFHLIQSYF